LNLAPTPVTEGMEEDKVEEKVEEVEEQEVGS
jgi:hypothetical protein